MPQKQRIRLIIAHPDAFIAADLASRLFMHWPELEMSAVIQHGAAVLDALNHKLPDILIIDPCMTELTGLELTLQDKVPAMVFLANTTELHTLFKMIEVDTLCPPIAETELTDLVKKLQTTHHQDAQSLAQLYRVRSALAKHGEKTRWVAAHIAQQMHWLDLGDVLYLQRHEERTLAQTACHRYSIPQALDALIPQLDDSVFAPASADLRVNILGISYAHPNEQGEMQLGLRQREETLKVDEQYAHLFH